MKFSLDEQATRLLGEKGDVTHFATGIAVMKDGKVLLVKRAPHDFLGGNYELPGGGVDDGETIVESMAREMKEELGLTPKKIIGNFKGFDYSTNKKPKVRQINFIVEPEDYMIKLDPNEHVEFKWVGRNDYQKLFSTTDEVKNCLADLFRLS